MSVKKVSAVALAAAMLVSMAACSQSSSSTASSSAASSSADSSAASSETASTSSEAATTEFSYPMEGDKTLTYWVGVSVSNYNDNNAKLPMWQQMMEDTGVTIEFIHPVVGQEQENFNLMLASGDYADIIESKYALPATMLDDGIIIDLTEILPQYAPNLYNYLQENPEIDRQVKNDDGQYLLFPFIRPDPLLQVSSGPIVRKDWLDQLGMELPETIDEWTAMLTGFRDQCGATVPLCFASSADLDRMMYAWETVNTFVNENGTVEYGYLRDGYRGFLEQMNAWYTEGLLDPNYPSSTRQILDTNILTGVSGATYGSGGSYLGAWLTAKPAEPASYDLTGLKYPVLEKGTTNKHGNNVQFEFSDSNGWAMITTQCEDVETAARFLDYGYTEAGHMLLNFGIEGESYTMVDGVPTYTDAMFNDPDGKSVSDTLGYYVRATGSGPFVQDPGYILQYYETQQQKDALALWSDQDQKSTKMPPIVHTTEEATEYSSIMNDIETYIKEEQVKFITGTKSFDEFDAFIEQINKMNIARAIEIKQNALDRYNAR